jgi:hypothetical protein
MENGLNQNQSQNSSMSGDENQGGSQNQNSQNSSGSAAGGDSQQASGDATVTWRDALPPELKSEKSLERFKDVSEVAKSWIEAQKVISQKGVIVPGEKATPEEVAAFHKAIGRPDTPDGYQLKAPELPEGMTYDENRTKVFAAVAHKEGVSAKALSALHGAWNDMARAEYDANVKAVQEIQGKTTAEMKKEWGKDFDANLAKADEAIERVFGSEFKQMLKDTGLSNHPAVIKGMFKASQAIGEHALSRGGGDGAGKGTFTKAELTQKTNDPRYWDVARRDNNYVEEVNRYAEALAAQSTGA